MAKQYINISIKLPAEKYDLAIGILYDFPFTGIEEKNTCLIVSFRKEDWTAILKNDLLKGLEAIYPEITIDNEDLVIEKNWNEEWERHVQAIHVSPKIGIAPSWRREELSEEISIIINPKMSFGTGHHHSTRLMCRIMENCVEEGSFWIDAGCGTGILSILAIKLGAAKVYAFDNNEWAVENSHENFHINKVSENIKIEETDLISVNLPKANAIAANMNRNLVLAGLPKFYDSLAEQNGILLASGILIEDRDELVVKAESHGYGLIDEIFEDDWIALKFGIR